MTDRSSEKSSGACWKPLRKLFLENLAVKHNARILLCHE
jgi:hypothetical protein